MWFFFFVIYFSQRFATNVAFLTKPPQRDFKLCFEKNWLIPFLQGPTTSKIQKTFFFKALSPLKIEFFFHALFHSLRCKYNVYRLNRTTFSPHKNIIFVSDGRSTAVYGQFLSLNQFHFQDRIEERLGAI